MAGISRRQFGTVALGGLGTVFALSACSGAGAPSSAAKAGAAKAGAAKGGAYKAADLNFSWWGAAERAAYTETIIADYERAHPAVKIAPQPGDWGGYWDKLSTQIAANTTPDIIQMSTSYLAEYGGRGALLDLSKQPTLDLSNLSKLTLAAGTYQGKLFGIPVGNSAYCVLANEKVFKAAGVAMPNDETWTWKDYQAIAAKITKATNGKVYGVIPSTVDSDLSIWLRQHGEELFLDSGKLGFTTKVVEKWIDNLKALIRSTGSPSADVLTQDGAAPLEQRMFSTSKAAMTWNSSNQVPAYAATAGDGIKMLRSPSVTGKAADAGMSFSPAVLWSASSRTKYPEQTAAFISYLLNSIQVGELMMTERGMPVNPKILNEIKSGFGPSDAQQLAFLTAIKPDVKTAPSVPPKGTSTSAVVVRRHVSDVLFGRTTSAAAAAALKTELQSLIQNA